MEKQILPIVLLSMCLVFKGDDLKRRAVLYELLNRPARQEQHDDISLYTAWMNSSAAVLHSDTTVFSAVGYEAAGDMAAREREYVHAGAGRTATLMLGSVSLAGLFSFDRGETSEDADNQGMEQVFVSQDELAQGHEYTAGLTSVQRGPESLVEPEVVHVSLEKYVRLGLDSTITQDIPGVKKERLKQALEEFLIKFFVYHPKDHKVIFMTQKVTYADVEDLYKKLKKSKNLLGRGATFLGIADDPLGNSVTDFLALLNDETSPLYATFSNCTRGVVGHMQQNLKADLRVDDIPMLTDRGEYIAPTMFAKVLCKARNP